MALHKPINSLAVGLGELKISHNPGDVLVAYGLGSCLGIGMYDPVTHVAGLLHAILPVKPGLNERGASPTFGGSEKQTKYVDSGVAVMLDQMTRAGADRERLILRVAGGANMLVAPGFSQVLNIGARNIETAFGVFQSLGLQIASQEVGGNIGRTVRFYVADGRMTIRTMGNQEREI